MPAILLAVTLTYLGNAGWRIEDGKTVVLVDPYLSQFKTARGRSPKDDSDPGAEPDAALIPKYFEPIDLPPRLVAPRASGAERR